MEDVGPTDSCIYQDSKPFEGSEILTTPISYNSNSEFPLTLKEIWSVWSVTPFRKFQSKLWALTVKSALEWKGHFQEEEQKVSEKKQ